MAKRKLKAALDKYQGVDHKLEKQKKTQKQAEKRKRQKLESNGDVRGELSASALKEAKRLAQTEQRLAEEALAADAAELLEAENGGEVGGWETDESEVAAAQERGGVDLAALDDESDSDSDEDERVQNDADELNDEAEEEDIPLSDIESLASEEKGDVIPHQRLTINNTAALQRSLKSFALPSSLPFSAVQSVTSTEPVQIADVDDDLNRELAFYKQSLDAVKEARQRLKKEGVPFSRPPDYFAEMVKSEELMGKVRQKMVDEAARKKASVDARRQRDLKKFGKAVQVAKLQERDKAKRDTMDKINVLKRKRQGADLNANEDDMFDIALEDAAVTEKADRAARRGGEGAAPNRKRQKKDAKFGFGGKKRFSKSNDAKSAGDERGYSVKKMKGKPQRPGKSRRARTRVTLPPPSDPIRSITSALSSSRSWSPHRATLRPSARRHPNGDSSTWELGVSDCECPPRLWDRPGQSNHFLAVYKFQSDHDLDIVSELTNEAGLYELEKQAVKAYKAARGGDRESEDGDNSFDPAAPWNNLTNPNDPKLVRKHLDSGILIQLMDKYETKLFSDDIEFLRHPGNILVLLADCAMQLGCTICTKHRKVLEKVFMCVELPSDAVNQMEEALMGAKAYQNGQAYHFNSPGLIETANNMADPELNARGHVGMNVWGPGTMFYRPPNDSTAGLMELKADFKKERSDEDVCGGCGAKKTANGKDLLACGACKIQKYCSKECQKKQWKVHKGDCAELRQG